ncbi:RNA polymerase sigma factor [Pseudoalteromonas sp. T1lg88]|uniref:RNA polymerase sigma factor n=1 Tax=Pseudoalteromonas sp. T1lg88 TaxID=2077104 RepID=UPI003FA380AF
MKRHEKRLYNQCLRLLQHPDDALDVMQETFISAYQGLGQFNGQSQLIPGCFVSPITSRRSIFAATASIRAWMRWQSQAVMSCIWSAP